MEGWLVPVEIPNPNHKVTSSKKNRWNYLLSLLAGPCLAHVLQILLKPRRRKRKDRAQQRFGSIPKQAGSMGWPGYLGHTHQKLALVNCSM